MTAAALLANLPGYELKIYNRGVSGNRSPDLKTRWNEDCLNLNPDVVSLMIGVNDEWRFHDSEAGGTPLDQYAADYRGLLEGTRERNPDVELVLCEPFTLRCGAVTEAWFPSFDERRRTVEHLAIEFEARFVPFHQIFEAACEHAPPSYWAGDGVHPTPQGHMLLSQNWLKAVVG